MSSTINPLANPKGVKTLCELCQKPAKLQCTNCRVTYYCNPDHQQTDWTSIHEKVCPLLVSIHSPPPLHTLQADRERHHRETLKKQEQLIEIAHLEAQKWVSKKSFHHAIPAALLFLRWAMRLYGSHPVKLVPAYLLLAQANIGLDSMSQAREYLTKAEWAVMNTPDCNPTVHHQLHRSLGRLHAATGKYSSALFHFSNDVYYASEVFGLDSIVTFGGYFLMAEVFLKQNKPDVTRSLYTEVACFWHTHLCKLMEGISQSGIQAEDCFGDAQCVEVDQMLRCILEFEEQYQKPRSDQSALLVHSLAMLWLLCNNYTKALEYGKKAEVLIQGSSEQNSMRESIQNLLHYAEKHLQ
ncbi:zinc finger MYND domain-containing protein 12 [Triplophysa rosa]|uniref:Zinc finger MYND domain-containing protein 12 n=1 Tax=Triplophysa rosa TaxID=992332 RepID=A0A9W7TJL1_TRIRA|nr:zinc finger MYND domain-containing protein 12 [Triplophysa rosa]KAI7797616.1 zinc finger MYND domain-containing protein 12 [Triplophysa rosa]